MNQPILDYWTGPSLPRGWRGDLFWSYASGIGSGIIFVILIAWLLGDPTGGCCLGGLLVISAMLGSSILLGTAEIRIRMLQRAFHVRRHTFVWLAGVLFIPSLICSTMFVEMLALPRGFIAGVLVVSVWIGYHCLAAVVLIRPGHALDPVAADAAPPRDPDIPIAQLADPPPPNKDAAPLPSEKGSESHS